MMISYQELVRTFPKTFVQETLKDTWESADEWFVH